MSVRDACTYPSDYCKTIYVSKTELGPALNFGQRTSGTFILDKAWPYAIDAVPLQFGCSCGAV